MAEYVNEIAKLKSEYAEQIDRLKAEHKIEVEDLRARAAVGSCMHLLAFLCTSCVHAHGANGYLQSTRQRSRLIAHSL